jgi:type IV pilus assembly protein PilQ
MIMNQTGKLLRLIFVASLMVAGGCAQQMKSVQADVSPELSVNGEIKSITVSEDGGRVDIVSDRPIVYTYYLLDSPPKIVIDLAQMTAGTLLLPIEANKGAVRRIDVTKHQFGSGVLSRVDINLSDKVDVTAYLDPQDKRHLSLALSSTAARSVETKTVEKASADVKVAEVIPPVVDKEPAAVTQEAKPQEEQVKGSAAPEVKKSEEATPVEAKPAKTEPPKGVVAEIPTEVTPKEIKPEMPAGPRVLQAITASEDGVNLVFSSVVEGYNSFKLSNPERLVIDVVKTKNEIPLKSVEINRFNLGKARFGGASDKLRIVFDAVGPIPRYMVTKTERGLLIAFSESALKTAAASTRESVESSASPVAVAAPPSVPVASTERTLPTSTQPDKEPVAVAEAKAAPAAPEATATAEVKTAVTPEKAPAPTVTEKSLAGSVPSAGKEVTAAQKSDPPAKSVVASGIIDAIEFTQNDGLSRITLKTGGGCTVTDPVKSAKGLYVTVKGCRLPTKLQRQLDTRGFESSIREIVPYPIKAKGGPEARIAVTMRTPVPNAVKREDSTFVWEFREPTKPVKMSKPAVTLKQEIPEVKAAASMAVKAEDMDKDLIDAKQAPAKSKGEPGLEEAFSAERLGQSPAKTGRKYTGRKVSLEFSDADVRKIFQLIAEVSNQNFLLSDDVTGTISLKLVNVPWDQALDVILENKNLGMQKDGNIVQIRPKAKIKTLDQEEIDMRETAEKKMPLSTVIFDVNFAKIDDIKTHFEKLKSKRNDASISADARTNKIIVVDIEPNIKKMRSLLESLDVPEKQVMIEARIVEASSNFARDIGIKWNFGYQDASASVANINNITGSMGGVVTNVLPTGTTGGLAAGMAFGKLLSNIQLDMRLSAAATVGQVKIISTPKVLTVNNMAAKISQGQMIPYQNTSSTEGARTEFIEAALSLEVTPKITADGSVSMKIKASNNSVGTGSPPPINKKEATTELVVKNGETTVIGGIYVDSETEGDTGIPYLSDIPLLGWLFKSNSKNKTKNELLIFITPKIMS